MYSRSGTIILVIPCHRPSGDLPELVSEVLRTPGGPLAVVVVDDGNGPDAALTLSRLEAIPGVTLLRHAINLGAGAALKTGFQHALVTWPDATGIVMADADGQHAAPDIVRVAATLRANPGHVVLGCRRFKHAPLRSRVGNELTVLLFRLLTGCKMSDTQTGLRGWPINACKRNVQIALNGFDYLLECLLLAKEPFLEVPIQTIYLEGNKSSHFNPVTDSLRIYFVLLRYCGSSLASWAIDAVIFYPAYFASGSIIASQFGARAVSATFAFFLARKLVFKSDTSVAGSLGRYVGLVAMNGLISYGMIQSLHAFWGVPVVAAKLLSETVLFIGNFAIQRAFIFTRTYDREEARAPASTGGMGPERIESPQPALAARHAKSGTG